MAAQEGRIVLLTTNHLEKLDRALIRPGRIDMTIELSNATAQQLRTMFLRFYPEATQLADEITVCYPDKNLSPARIQQSLLESDDAEGAVRLITEAIEK